MSWEDWAKDKAETLRVLDARVLHDPDTFMPFVMVRVRINLGVDDASLGLNAQDHLDYAKRLVEEKIK